MQWVDEKLINWKNWWEEATWGTQAYNG